MQQWYRREVVMACSGPTIEQLLFIDEDGALVIERVYSQGQALDGTVTHSAPRTFAGADRDALYAQASGGRDGWLSLLSTEDEAEIPVEAILHPMRRHDLATA